MSIPNVAAAAAKQFPDFNRVSNDDLMPFFRIDEGGPLRTDLPLALAFLDDLQNCVGPLTVKRCLHSKPDVYGQVSRVFTSALWYAVAPQYPRLRAAFAHDGHVYACDAQYGEPTLPSVTIDELKTHFPLGWAALDQQMRDGVMMLNLPPHSPEGKEYRMLFAVNALPVISAHFNREFHFYNCCGGAAAENPTPPTGGKGKPPSLALQLQMQLTPDC
jgi:hypothetical protein